MRLRVTVTIAIEPLARASRDALVLLIDGIVTALTLLLMTI